MSGRVKAGHPLNVGRRDWWLALPGLAGGPLWYDVMGLQHGTLKNFSAGFGWAPTARPGGFATLAFDGADDHVRLGSPISFPTSEAWTWAAWFNRSSTTSPNSIFGDGSGFTRTVFTSATALYIANDANAQSVVTYPTTVGVWTRFVMASRGNGSQVDIYKDGAFVATINPGGTFTFRDIGRGYADYYWAGRLDDIALWNRALSATEVRADYDLSRRGYPGVLRSSTSRAAQLFQPATASAAMPWGVGDDGPFLGFFEG